MTLHNYQFTGNFFNREYAELKCLYCEVIALQDPELPLFININSKIMFVLNDDGFSYYLLRLPITCEETAVLLVHIK